MFLNMQFRRLWIGIFLYVTIFSTIFFLKFHSRTKIEVEIQNRTVGTNTNQNYKFEDAEPSRIPDFVLHTHKPKKNKAVKYDYYEITEILENTPYLWRRSVPSRKKSISSRIQDQDLWIQRISKTNFVRNAKPKKILVRDKLDLYLGTEGRLKCPYAPEFEDRCILVSHPSLESSSSSSAIKSPGAEFTNFLITAGINAVTKVIRHDTMPLIPLEEDPPLPKNVKEIFYVWDSPYMTKSVDLSRNKAILASYTRASDIPIPHRRWINHENALESTSEFMDNIDKMITSKKKMVATILSNCNKTLNNRLEFIAKLQKHIDVDIYGECGDFSCPNSTNNIDCLKMLEKDYRYYLAYENSNCEDYITETFFEDGLKYSMIPIVMGAHQTTYKTEGPDYSFIHVDDFVSPEILAEYLVWLSLDDDLYKEYFKYKGTGEITNEGHETFFCKICGMLYYSDFVSVPSWKPGKTWEDVNYCLPQGQYYWNISSYNFDYA